MLAFFKKHFGAILAGTVINLPALGKGAIWLTDWLSRFDFWKTYGSELPGAAVMIGYLTNPPPWTVFITSSLAVLIVLWDVRRQTKTAEIIVPAAALDPYRKLRLGFYSICAVIGVSVWVVAWPTIFPSMTLPRPPAPPGPTSKLVSNLSRVILVCDSPKPEKPPTLEERKADLAERLDVLEKIFGQTVTGDVTDSETTLSTTFNTLYGAMSQSWLAKRSGDKIYVSIKNELGSENAMSLFWALGSIAPLNPDGDMAKQYVDKVEQALKLEPGKCKLV